MPFVLGFSDRGAADLGSRPCELLVDGPSRVLIVDDARQSGAFVLPANGRDAALLVTLRAGNYTASVAGVGGTTGTALVEIYVVP